MSTQRYIIQIGWDLNCSTQQRSKFHLWKDLMNINPAALRSSTDQTCQRRKQSRCHNNSFFLFFIPPLYSIARFFFSFFLFIFLICFALNQISHQTTSWMCIIAHSWCIPSAFVEVGWMRFKSSKEKIILRYSYNTVNLPRYPTWASTHMCRLHICLLTSAV